MGNVARMVNAIDRSASQLSDDLKNFLDLVWTHRLDHRKGTFSHRNANPYGIYSKKMKNFTHSERSMNEFLDGILNMPILPEVQCSFYNEKSQLTRYLRHIYLAKKAGFAKLDRDMFSEMVDDARVNAELNKLLSKTFYHFRRVLGTRSLYRIYLNVRPLQAIRVMEFIVRDIVMQPTRFPNVSNAKVSAPGKSTRADSIIIYFSQENAMNAVLDAITNYQRRGGHNYFEHGAPRATKPVSRHNNYELKGVGIGAEPPFKIRFEDEHVTFPDGSSSFGSFRSQLIAHALKQTMRKGSGNNLKPEFFNQVAQHFRNAGINPREPFKHIDCRPLLTIVEPRY